MGVRTSKFTHGAPSQAIGDLVRRSIVARLSTIAIRILRVDSDAIVPRMTAEGRCMLETHV
jgi:hypothetical protein